MKRSSAIAAMVVLLIACGKRGDPRPPVPVIPQATSDLVVTQRANRIVLSWSYPSLTTVGRNLSSIRRISVYRYVENLPAVPAGLAEGGATLPPGIDPALPRPVALFSSIPQLPKAQFIKLSSRIESIEKANLASATAGARLLFTDTPPLTTSDGRPVRISYAVVTEGESARSEHSNVVSIVPLPALNPPGELTAEPRAEGVVLRWTTPTTITGETDPAAIAGYHVYRNAPGESVNDLATPITTGPVTDTSWIDSPGYGDYEYRVAAVANAGLPIVQSELSAPVRVTFKDLMPPPAPASITPLIEPNAVRVIWDAVEAPDLAGYRLYRYEGIGHENNIVESGGFALTPQIVTETVWVDRIVALGIAYRYEVVAVDKNGNESARTKTGWVVAPKTP